MVRARAAVLVAALACGAASVPAQGSGSAATPAARAAAPGDVVVNKFMSYNADAKTVQLKLVSALGSANGGMNFNGGARGDQTIIIPLGWTVKVAFENKDAIPHSAILIPDTMPMPMAPDTPAIPGAYTRDVTGGIPTGGTDTMNFKAKPAGKYLMACGVPGHAPSGMYIKFVVSADAKVPAYQMK
jgi:sulfocyanin